MFAAQFVRTFKPTGRLGKLLGIRVEFPVCTGLVSTKYRAGHAANPESGVFNSTNQVYSSHFVVGHGTHISELSPSWHLSGEFFMVRMVRPVYLFRLQLVFCYAFPDYRHNTCIIEPNILALVIRLPG